MEFAYSRLEIKSIDDEQRTFSGIATSPATDRAGDIIESAGIRFKNPVVLQLHHDRRLPVGTATLGVPTSKGTPFRASIPFVTEPGRLKERTDEAWHSVKYGVIRGVSVGFPPPPPTSIEVLRSGGVRFKDIEIVELSLVSIPAHQDATITHIKSLDAPFLAASGTRTAVTHQPGAAGQSPTGRQMTNSEQLTAAKTELQTKNARLVELMAQDESEGGLSATEQTERDQVKTSLDALTKKVGLLMTIEAANGIGASPIAPRSTEERRVQIYGQPEVPKVTVKALPKGTAFTRYAMAVAAGKGSYSDTVAYAKRWEGQTPEVLTHIKHMFGKAVEGTASSAASPNWGSELVYANNLASEFIELLNAATIMGRIEGFRRVPFNVRMVRQTQGSTVNWVGESDPKPVSELDFDTVTQPWHKIAGIVVITEELVRLSSPDAEATVRADLVEQIGRFKDRQFIDPTVTATANRPASITNGVASPAASGTTAEDLRADLNTALATFDTAETAVESIVILMTPALARGISTLTNALGQAEFPGLTMRGGTLMGFPVIVSNSVPAGHIIVVAASEILLSEDPNVALDASNQATIDMAGGTSPTFSLWQRNCVGIRAEQFATWQTRRDAAVAIIDTAAYGPTAP